MATLTPILISSSAVAQPSAVNFSASDVIDTSSYKTENIAISIVSAAEAGEKSLELTIKAGIGTNAVADKTYTVAPAASVIIKGFEAARFVNKDGKIDVVGALSSTGTGATLADYSARIYAWE